jgi:hypothetical protein
MTYEKTIAKLKRQIASLEAKASRAVARKAKSDREKVVSLAKKLGYKTAHVLYAALFKGGEKLDELIGTTDTTTTRTRKRWKITGAKRKAVIAALKSGKVAAKVAKKVGISLPSVNNIKRAEGLTKSKKRPSRRLSLRSSSRKVRIPEKAIKIPESPAHAPNPSGK